MRDWPTSAAEFASAVQSLLDARSADRFRVTDILLTRSGAELLSEYPKAKFVSFGEPVTVMNHTPGSRYKWLSGHEFDHVGLFGLKAGRRHKEYHWVAPLGIPPSTYAEMRKVGMKPAEAATTAGLIHDVESSAGAAPAQPDETG